MIGGYQIIDLSDFIEYNGVYIPKREYKWSLEKPVRLTGLLGKSTNAPTLDYINVWTSYTQSTGDVTYEYTDAVANMSVKIELSDEDQFGGVGDYPIYAVIEIIDN